MESNLTRRDAAKLAAGAAAAVSAAATPELCFRGASELARMIRRKEVSAREVMEAHLRQIERVNPKVNAIVTLTGDRAMEQAKKADEAQAKGGMLGPLHGLPTAHKDLQETKGIRTTFGSPLFKDHIPDKDSILVERVKAAGAITVGKTNTPEFGAGSQTFNRVFGATKNPYDVTKTCGGSSGGAAVALACGMVPIADGSDTGGSLRNPAAFCNVVGLRPAPGRVPRNMSWGTLSVEGPMARNVADVALFLSAMAGPDDRCPISIAEAGNRFAAPLETRPKGLRIAWLGDLGFPFDSRVRGVVDGQRKAFESLGCLVENAQPDFRGADEVFKVLRAASFTQQHAGKVKTHRAEIKDTVLWEVDRGLKLTAVELMAAEQGRARIYERARVFMEKYDFLVLPVTQVPPFDVNQPFITEIAGVKMDTYIDWMKSCYFITVLGNPALSVPCGFTPEGLPVGMQIVGRHRDEWRLLQIAYAFEQATGFAKRRPAVVG